MSTFDLYALAHFLGVKSSRTDIIAFLYDVFWY